MIMQFLFIHYHCYEIDGLCYIEPYAVYFNKVTYRCHIYSFYDDEYYEF